MKKTGGNASASNCSTRTAGSQSRDASHQLHTLERARLRRGARERACSTGRHTIYFVEAMTRRWLTTLILIAAMLGGALAGVHNNVGEHSCPMVSIGDCCATAHKQDQGPQVSAARLCCALNCTEPGTTVPTGAFNLSSQLSAMLYAGVVPPAVIPTTHPSLPRPYPASHQPPESQPAYIRHLALLI